MNPTVHNGGIRRQPGTVDFHLVAHPGGISVGELDLIDSTLIFLGGRDVKTSDSASRFAASCLKNITASGSGRPDLFKNKRSGVYTWAADYDNHSGLLFQEFQQKGVDSILYQTADIIAEKIVGILCRALGELQSSTPAKRAATVSGIEEKFKKLVFFAYSFGTLVVRQIDLKLGEELSRLGFNDHEKQKMMGAIKALCIADVSLYHPKLRCVNSNRRITSVSIGSRYDYFVGPNEFTPDERTRLALNASLEDVRLFNQIIHDQRANTSVSIEKIGPRTLGISAPLGLDFKLYRGRDFISELDPPNDPYCHIPGAYFWLKVPYWIDDDTESNGTHVTGKTRGHLFIPAIVRAVSRNMAAAAEGGGSISDAFDLLTPPKGGLDVLSEYYAVSLQQLVDQATDRSQIGAA